MASRWCRVAVVAVACAAVFSATPAFGIKRYLFDLDDFARVENVTIRLHRPDSSGSAHRQVVTSTEAWESNRIWAYNSVVDNGTHVLLYYYVFSTNVAPGDKPGGTHQGLTCVAISEDGGETFTKPKLGIVTVNGSTANNIVWPPVMGVHHEPGVVFIDEKPGTPLQEKYKFIARWGNGTFTFSSPDGLRFTPLDASRPAYTDSDTQNTAFYDTSLKKYVAYRRQATSEAKRQCDWCVGNPPICGAGSPALRQVGRCISDSLAYFPGCEREAPLTPGPLNENCSMVASFDDEDPPCMDVYTNGVVKYDDGNYLMFPSMYTHFPNPPNWCCGNDGLWDSRIMHSRDGLHFSYIGGDRGPWLSRGVSTGPPLDELMQLRPEDDWDSSLVAFVRGMVRRPGSRELRMYKWGDRVRHGQRANSPDTGISTFTMRLDGFASMRPAAPTWPTKDLNEHLHDGDRLSGLACTAPLHTSRTSLTVNVVTAAGGQLLVALKNTPTSPAPITGYSIYDVTALVGNFVNATVSWKGNSTLPVQTTFSVCFAFVGAVDLFSYAL